MIQVPEFIFYASLTVFAGFYAVYYLICHFYRSRPKARTSAPLNEDKELPKVSLIVPVFNENRILEKKIQNLQELAYPRDMLEARAAL